MSGSNPLKAIRAKCLDCVYNAQEVKLCVSVNCALHPFRFGKNPFRAKSKRVWTDEQRAAAAEKMKHVRSLRKEEKDDE